MRGAQFVDPSALARIRNLELLARTVVDGFINGLHRAPHLGFSLDFAEHRGYEPGDDLRRVDWRVFARTDRYYVKQFEADSNANLVVALDVSSSMRYGSRRRHEARLRALPRRVAAVLLAPAARPRRPGHLRRREVREYVPPSARHLEFGLYALDRVAEGRPGALAAPLLRLTERLVRRGIVVVISDLYDEPEAIANAVRPLRYRGHDVIVFHVLDPAEIDFPFTEAASFEDLETGARMPIVPASVREQYQALVRQHTEALGRLFTDSRIDYALFNTVGAARPRAVPLPVGARAPEPGPLMSFLAPALLAGLLAIAIPIVVHLVQRERRTTQAFPSLMFLRRIPNQSVRRRAIRHWPLLALRILAFVLIALAFARPLLTAGGATVGGGAAARATWWCCSTGRRAWATAITGPARRTRRGASCGSSGPVDGGAVVFFAADVEVAARSDAGAGRARWSPPSTGRARARASRGSARRCARRPACWSRSSAPRREVVLDLRLPEVGLGPGAGHQAARRRDAHDDFGCRSACRQRGGRGLDARAGRPAPKGVLVTAAARVANYGAQPVTDREVTLEVDGHRVGAARVSVGAGRDGHRRRSRRSSWAAATPGVTARMAPDALPADDTFHALVTVGGQVPVLILESSNPAPDASLYLARALDVAAAPGFAARIVRADRVTPEEIAGAAVIVLNDTPPPAGAAGRALASAVHDGAGLLVVLGERSTWTDANFDLLPGKLGAPIDRSGTSGGTLGYIDFSHPAFEIFRSPRSGDLTAARIFRYRALSAPSKVLAQVRRWGGGGGGAEGGPRHASWRGRPRSTATGTTCRSSRCSCRSCTS